MTVVAAGIEALPKGQDNKISFIAENSPLLIPGQIPELDVEVRGALARVIRDHSIEFTGEPRVKTGVYDAEQYQDYYEPLFDVLELDPEIDPPVSERDIYRASKIGLVPSYIFLQRAASLRQLNRERGFRPTSQTRDWSRIRAIRYGTQLGNLLDKRFTKKEVRSAAIGEMPDHFDEFPTIANIRRLFDGGFVEFQELSGRPSAYGWERSDYLDWVYSVFRQTVVYLDFHMKR